MTYILDSIIIDHLAYVVIRLPSLISRSIACGGWINPSILVHDESEVTRGRWPEVTQQIRWIVDCDGMLWQMNTVLQLQKAYNKDCEIYEINILIMRHIGKMPYSYWIGTLNQASLDAWPGSCFTKTFDICLQISSNCFIISLNAPIIITIYNVLYMDSECPVTWYFVIFQLN